MQMLRTSTGKAVALGAAAFLAFLTPAPTQAQTGAIAAPTEEDFVLLQLQVKKFSMRNELRGYQTVNGVCVDLADLILALDLPVRHRVKRARHPPRRPSTSRPSRTSWAKSREVYSNSTCTRLNFHSLGNVFHNPPSRVCG